MLILHTLVPGDEMEIWIPAVDQHVEVRISREGAPEIFCTPETAVFRRNAAVFKRRAEDAKPADFSVMPSKP